MIGMLAGRQRSVDCSFFAGPLLCGPAGHRDRPWVLISVFFLSASRLHGAEVQLVLVDDALRLAETPQILYLSLQCLAATVMAILSLGCLLQVGGRLEGDAFDC